MKIDSLLPVQQSFEKSYYEFSKIGQDFLKSQRIGILGLVRNLEPVLINNINRIVNIFSIAQEYKIFLFENDSTDNTKNILGSLDNKNITIRTENYGRKQFGTTKEKERTQALAEYRNIGVEWIKNNYSNSDFVVVVDFDFVDLSDNGCYNSFGWLKNHEDIHAIAGNSFEFKPLFGRHTQGLWNYDSWAYRGTWWEDLVLYHGSIYSYNPMLWFGFWKLPVGSSLIKVNSAFGGMTIYRTSKFINGIYDGYDCEHVCFHYSLSKTEDFNIYINPSQRMLLK